MHNQLLLFTGTAKMPPKGLTTPKEQAMDMLEGLRRKEGAKEEAMGLFKENKGGTNG